MRSPFKSIFWVVGTFLGVASAAAAADPAIEQSVDEIATVRDCARANLPQTSFSQNIELTSWDAGGGKRSLVGQLFGVTDGEQRISLMMSVGEPQDLAGARYLLNRRGERDNMYVYLPAMSRTRRIMGGMKGQPLWGTDFSYEDIKHLQASLSEPDTEYLGTGQVAERTFHKLRVIPMAESESAYTSIEIDIDEQTCLLLGARFFDSSGVLKRMDSNPESFSQLGSRWVPGMVSIENLRSQTRSSLKMENYVFDEDLSNSYFNPKAFHLAR
ncbi:MAG: outer membrane lipoprotein-sorting protein [Oceanococcus sp.]